VEFELVLTIGLVVMVIFVFLRNLYATIIPAIAIPISLVGRRQIAGRFPRRSPAWPSPGCVR